MANNQLSAVGRLKKKYDMQQVSPTFRKREFILEIADGPYPQYVSFQLTQDRVGLIDVIQEGTEIEVFFNLRGREWTPKDGGETKYFNSLDAWRVTAPQTATGMPPQGQYPGFSQPQNPQAFQQTQNPSPFQQPQAPPYPDLTPSSQQPEGLPNPGDGSSGSEEDLPF